MKRILSMILSGIMVLALLPGFTVFAVNNPDYVIDDNDYVAGTDALAERVVETNRYRETLVEFIPKKDGIYSFMLGTGGVAFDKENTEMLMMTLYLDGEVLATGEQYFDEEDEDAGLSVCEIDAYCLADKTYYIGIDMLPEGENEVGLTIWRYEEVKNVEFVPAKPYEYIENTDVYPDFNEGDRLIIHGEENTYIYTYQKELLFGSFYEEEYVGGEARQGAPLTDRFSAEPELLPEFSENEAFTGNLLFRFFGTEQVIPVQAVENPVKSIQYTMAQPLLMMESDAAIEVDGAPHYDYERYDMFGCAGDQLTINYKDGTTDTYYCGLFTIWEIFDRFGIELPEDMFSEDGEEALIDEDDIGEIADDEYIYEDFMLPLFENADGEFLNLDYLRIYDNQLESPWKLGTNYYYVSYMGVECTVPVRIIAPGWYRDNGKWYYYIEGNGMAYNWQKIDGKWYYFSPYEVNAGEMFTGWQKIDGKWYYLNASGAMVTGWQKVGGKWYYLNASGAMATGWQKVGGKWYYLNASGAMATGWQKVGGKWYYLNTSGAMVTGWQKISGKWYFFNQNGAMATGWKKVGSIWYYLETSGAMRTTNLTQSGKTYRFNASGACINP